MVDDQWLGGKAGWWFQELGTAPWVAITPTIHPARAIEPSLATLSRSTDSTPPPGSTSRLISSCLDLSFSQGPVPCRTTGVQQHALHEHRHHWDAQLVSWLSSIAFPTLPSKLTGRPSIPNGSRGSPECRWPRLQGLPAGRPCPRGGSKWGFVDPGSPGSTTARHACRRCSRTARTPELCSISVVSTTRQQLSVANARHLTRQPQPPDAATY